MDSREEGFVAKKSVISRCFPISGMESEKCWEKNWRTLAGESSAWKSESGMKSVTVQERSRLGSATIIKFPLGQMCR
jgi:hypothetical protein